MIVLCDSHIYKHTHYAFLCRKHKNVYSPRLCPKNNPSKPEHQTAAVQETLLTHDSDYWVTRTYFTALCCVSLYWEETIKKGFLEKPFSLRDSWDCWCIPLAFSNIFTGSTVTEVLVGLSLLIPEAAEVKSPVSKPLCQDTEPAGVTGTEP